MSSKITSFGIIFDRDNRIYYPGEIVTGRIITKLSAPISIRGIHTNVIITKSSPLFRHDRYQLYSSIRNELVKPVKKIYNSDEFRNSRCLTSNESPKVVCALTEYVIKNSNARGLKLKFVGECLFKWRETECGASMIRIITHQGHKQYFSNTDYLLGSEFDSAFELPAGEHVHLFSYQLPHHLPSSFEHRYGYIRYTIKASIDRPWKSNHEAKTVFKILTNCDLNHKPQAAISVCEAPTISFGCCCFCLAGDFSVKIASPISGFVSSQTIPVIIDYENQSSTEVKKIKVQLRQKLEIDVATDSKEYDVIVAETNLPGPLSIRDDKLTIELKVPELPTSDMDYCAFLHLDYYLRVVICFYGCHCNIENTWPIVIGTVPLMSTMNMNGKYPPSASSNVTFDQQQIPGPVQFQQKPPELGFVMPEGGQQFAPNPVTEISGMSPMTHQPGIVQPPYPTYGGYNLPPPPY